jgi:hypothetical protein
LRIATNEEERPSALYDVIDDVVALERRGGGR